MIHFFMTNERLDRKLVAAGLARSRGRARELILAGAVSVDGKTVCKTHQEVSGQSRIEVDAQPQRFVSRGGFKLERALQHFQVTVTGAICLDVGASTGGFTDCLLQHGATRVVAIDAGHGQMDECLRSNPRVELHEKINARHLPDSVPSGTFDIIVVDVSFISLELVVPALLRCAGANCWMILLVKPQFEVGREKVGKGGVVREESHRRGALEKIMTCVSQLNGWTLNGVIDSPLAGGDGNQEYLLCIKKSAE